jgi:Domain of unknown function (DUF2341)
VPTAPTSPVATPSISGASVAFTLPVSDGGSPIISYTVTSSPGAIAAIGGASPITLSGLTNGVSYTFTVTATNSNGNSAPSAASNTVVPAPWYDALWTRRETITVGGSSAGAQTNYPVKLSIPYDAAMRADFSDLRFTDASGTSLLSHWVETETNSTSALVWVKVPSVPIAPGTATVYFYFGNPAAHSMSNGDTTFTLFDTFGAGGTPGDWNYTNNVIGEHAIIRNGKLYAPLYDSDHAVNGGLAVLNPINGAVIKHFSIPGYCTAAAPAFDKNGFLHVYDCGGFITKVDENTGTVLRSRSIGGALDWEAVPYDPVNDILLIASKDDRSLTAIRASDYSLVWRNTDVDLTYGSSEVAPPLIVGAYVYWQDYSAKLYKISLSTGMTVASTLATTVGFPATPYSFSSYSQIIFDSVNDRLYLTNSTGHTAFAINPADLSVAWSKVVESDGWNFNRGGAWHNNVWYVTARQTGYPYRSKIYALNTQSSGSVLWTNTTAYDNGAEVSSILADDNYVYAGSYDYIDQDYNKLLILNALDGTVASTIQLLNGVASSIPTFYGGKIIMGLWYDTSGQQVGGYQALQVRAGGGTDDFYYKADLNQTGYVGAFASGPLTARTACAYGLLDPTKWIVSGIYSITNCAAVSTVNSASWSNRFQSTLTFAKANTAIRVRAQNSEPSSNAWDAYLGFTNFMGSCLPVCFGRNNGQMVFGYDQNGTQQTALGPSYTFNQYNTAEVKMAYPSIQFDVNDSNLAASANWSTNYDNLPIQLGNFKGSAAVDWVLVRNYVNPEPTAISSLCSYQLSGAIAYASSAASGVVTISTDSACNWTGASNSPFLHITSAASGIGNGQVNISIDANATPSQRTGTLTIAGQTFTITQGGSIAVGGTGLRFVAITPCRIADTRNPTGAFGGPSLAAATPRDFNIQSSPCGIPANAVAYSLNMSVVPTGPLGYLTVWPTGQPQPFVSTLNSDGRIKGNAAIAPAGLNGSISVFVTNATHLIIDINGYFVPAVGVQNLAFYPLTPCRIADTRNPAGPFGGPSLAAAVTRDIPVPASPCGIPATAQAYSFNMTVVPPGVLGYLTTWPAGSPQPLVSTLNAPPGIVTANAAIVPAGVNGAISVFATQATDLVIDINGYFAPPGAAGSLDYFTSTPCRVLDTRLSVGPLGGPIMGAAESRSFPVPSSTCGIPATAKAYSMNATVVPATILGFLTLWGDGIKSLVATLNSGDGAITGNAALIQAGASGVVTAFTTQSSHLILDINGYFQ